MAEKTTQPSAEHEIGKAILDDRHYFREDEKIIDDMVLGMPFVCRVTLGLRRFGKSSFLRRVERFCNGVNDGWAPESARAGYAGVKAYFVECNVPSRMGSAIMRGLEDRADGVTLKLILLDDLQGYEKLFASNDAAIAEVDDALRALFKEARKQAGVRIVLSEPTRHREWLGLEEAKGEPAGQQLLRLCGKELGYVDRCLKPLSFEESRALLSGAPMYPQRAQTPQFELSRDQVQKLHFAFGGNPWFLGFAYGLIKERKDLAILREDRIVAFIEEVKAKIDLEDGGLSSMYKSLSKPERFVVDLLVDRWYTQHDPERLERGKRENRESLALFEPKSQDVWHAPARDVHLRLGEVGLVTTNEHGMASALSSEVFADFVHKKMRHGVPILDRPADLEEMWSTLISGRSPAERLTSRCVIHQFGDLLFEGAPDVGQHYWGRYLDWIRQLKENRNENTPHFIVICGNVLPGGAELSPNRYRERLVDAFEALRKAVQHLKPVHDDRPRPEQIIIVPGVLDINWPSVAKYQETEREQLLDDFYPRQKIWDELIGEYKFTVPARDEFRADSKGAAVQVPRSIRFDRARVQFIPFDTVAVAGVRDELGDEAASDLIDIRRRVRMKFGYDWEALREGEESGGKKGRGSKGDRLNRFLTGTWRYAFEITDPETTSDEKDGDESIETPTFRWIEYRPAKAGAKSKSLRPQEWVSEAGFVERSARTQLAAALSQGVERKPLLKIAVMHHAPRQLRRSTLVAFYESYRFRQAMTQAGIHWVMHGNSILQQRTDESVVLSRSRGGRPNDGSQKLHLLASGTFSCLPDYLKEAVSDDPEVELPSRPSFNEIVITPPDETDPKRVDFNITTRFWEWPSKDAEEPTESR